jgi:hypothetical protein
MVFLSWSRGQLWLAMWAVHPVKLEERSSCRSASEFFNIEQRFLGKDEDPLN